MKMFMGVCCSLFLAASAARADKVAPPATSSDDVAKFVAFFDKIADTVVADKTDCAKMATDVNKLIDDNAAVLEAAKRAQESGKQLSTEARNHMMATSKRMTSAMMEKCHDDQAVNAAFARLPKHGPPPAKH
jgi:hypothetical protein